MSLYELGYSILPPEEVRPPIDETAEDAIHDAIRDAANTNGNFQALRIEDQITLRAAVGDTLTGLFEATGFNLDNAKHLSSGKPGVEVTLGREGQEHPIFSMEELTSSLPESLRGFAPDILHGAIKQIREHPFFAGSLSSGVKEVTPGRSNLLGRGNSQKI